MRGRAELAALAAAVVLCVIGPVASAAAGKAPWGHYSVFVPVGLTVLALANAALRSKVLGWGLFTIALVMFMVVFGAAAVGYRGVSAVAFWLFVRGLALFAAIGAAGLYQLRMRAPSGAAPKGE